MKSITISSILLGLILISLTQCSKETKETDYRDAFIGDYNFTVNAHSHFPADSIFKDTVYYFSGNISKSDYPEAIKIYYKPNGGIAGKISPTGELDKIPGFGIGYSFGGKFEGVDKLWFRLVLLYSKDSVTGIRK
jgi:hypothetical protein